MREPPPPTSDSSPEPALELDEVDLADAETEEADLDGDAAPPSDVLPVDPALARDIAARCGWSTDGGPVIRRPLAAPLELLRDDERWAPDADANEADVEKLVQLEAQVVAGVLVDDRVAWDRFTSNYNPKLKVQPPTNADAARAAAQCAGAGRPAPLLFELVPRAVRARLTHWLRSEPEADRYQRHLTEIGEVRERVILRNLRLASRVAYEVFHQGLSAADRLVQGVAGVSRALDSYEVDGAANFSTYARQWIQARVTRAANETGGPVRIPGNLAERRMRLAREIRGVVLDGQPVHAPSDASSEWYPPTRIADDEALLALIEPPPAADDQICARRWDALERALGTLKARDREILEQRFALRGGERPTLAAIGDGHKLSRERIRQIAKWSGTALWGALQTELSSHPAAGVR